MENILWFHLECPKYIDYWDNPNFLKANLKQFINEKISIDLQRSVEVGERKRNKNMYNKNLYPEDMEIHMPIWEFDEKFGKELKPHPDEEPYKKPGKTPDPWLMNDPNHPSKGLSLREFLQPALYPDWAYPEKWEEFLNKQDEIDKEVKELYKDGKFPFELFDSYNQAEEETVEEGGDE